MPILRTLHAFYKNFVSPLLGNNCRFHPSCSDYSLEAIEKHGFINGSMLSLKRVFRCHPFSQGWFDPVPSLAKSAVGKPAIDLAGEKATLSGLSSAGTGEPVVASKRIDKE